VHTACRLLVVVIVGLVVLLTCVTVVMYGSVVALVFFLAWLVWCHDYGGSSHLPGSQWCLLV
jgi:hypothetical protein